MKKYSIINKYNLNIPPSPSRTAICIAIAIFLLVFIIRLQLPRLDGDFNYPLCEARAIISNQDPFTTCEVCPSYLSYCCASYPLTSALIMIPFLPLGEYAASLFFSLSCGLLAYALLADGKPWRLLVFLSFPFFHAIYYVQFTPLLVAIALLPFLMPLALVKPHIALPVILTRFTWRRWLACGVLVAVTLIIDPTWPVRWWTQAGGTYEKFIPLLVLPFGPLMLLALLRWKDKDARYLLIASVIPQRAIYDAFILFAILPKTKIQMLVLVNITWLMVFVPEPFSIVAFAYLPFLVLMLSPIMPITEIFNRLKSHQLSPHLLNK